MGCQQSAQPADEHKNDQTTITNSPGSSSGRLDIAKRTETSIFNENLHLGISTTPLHIQYAHWNQAASSIPSDGAAPSTAGVATIPCNNCIVSVLASVGADDTSALLTIGEKQNCFASALSKFIKQVRVQHYKASGAPPPWYQPDLWPHLTRDEIQACTWRAIEQLEPDSCLLSCHFHGDYVTFHSSSSSKGTKIVLGHVVEDDDNNDVYEDECKQDIEESSSSRLVAIPLDPSKKTEDSDEPGVLTTRLNRHDKYIILGNHIFDHLSPSQAVKLCSQHESPLAACQALTEAAGDDQASLQVIVCFVQSFREPGPGTTEELLQKSSAGSATTASLTDSSSMDEKETSDRS